MQFLPSLSSGSGEMLRRKAEQLCQKNGAVLLFLTFFGSTLYGTRTPGSSDLDVRGIFLPSQASLALNTAPASLHASTGDAKQRNTAEDVDLDLWSVQYWLLKLLPDGEIGALDMLFSPSHSACTLYRDPRLDSLFAEPLRLLSVSLKRTCFEYSMGQAKKYGLKGTRLGALKCVYNWLRADCPVMPSATRLRDVLADLTKACADGRFCAATRLRDETALQLCGKLHAGSVRLDTFAQRINQDMHRFGARVLEAEHNRGIDFKALSHALRALDQMEELLRTGAITFPLKTRDALMEVKLGRFSWQQAEVLLLKRLQEIAVLNESIPFPGRFDRAFAAEQILHCYKRTDGLS